MSNKIIYHVRNDYGGTFVKHAYESEHISIDELATLIADLQHLHKRMTERSLGQEDIKSLLYGDVTRSLLKDCVVYYPCNLPHISGQPNTYSRPPRSKRYNGVYFATHPDRPQTVKIGYSIDVYSRMKTLYHQYGKKPLTVIGFIETEKQKDIETLIHGQLAEYTTGGEWFEQPPAIELLKGLAS